jgi:hypothetical protein
MLEVAQAPVATPTATNSVNNKVVSLTVPVTRLLTTNSPAVLAEAAVKAGGAGGMLARYLATVSASVPSPSAFQSELKQVLPTNHLYENSARLGRCVFRGGDQCALSAFWTGDDV